MAVGTFIPYRKNLDRLSELDLTTATVKMALVLSAYTPDATNTGHSVYTDITNEVANGQGYTTGGNTLTGLSAPVTTNGFKFTGTVPVWTASGTGIPAHRYYVLYVSGALWGRTSPLIGYFLGDNTPADIPLTTSGNTLTVTASASGFFDVTS